MGLFIDDIYKSKFQDKEIIKENNPKIIEIRRHLIYYEGILTQKLTGENKEVFLKFAEEFAELTELIQQEYYHEGFKDGANFVKETFLD